MIPPWFSCLPTSARRDIRSVADGCADFWERLSEVHLRARHRLCIEWDGRGILLPFVPDAAELSTTFEKLCDHSVYAHVDSLREGYITVFGSRVGVAGRTVTEGGRIVGITDITSLCFRVAHHIPGAGAVALRVFRELDCRRGMLVYAPPGVGKTTLLRDFAYTVSAGATGRRVALIDSRGELYDAAAPPHAQIDVLRACPLARGIEMATRTLSPQVLVCDEIGSEAEAGAILSVAGCGVPLVASAHAGSLAELKARPPIALLQKNGIFGAYIGVARTETGGYTYTVEKEDTVCCNGWALLPS